MDYYENNNENCTKETLNTVYQLHELELDDIQSDINNFNSQAEAITTLTCENLKQKYENLKKESLEWKQLYTECLAERNRILKQLSNERSNLFNNVTHLNSEIEKLKIDKIVLQDELNEKCKKKRWWR